MNKKEMICYESDSSRMAGVIEKVLFPKSIEEVKNIVKNSRTDIIPRGAGTGLVGGCVPNNSIIVDMSKMTSVSNFLPLRKTVRVEAGITLKELNEKLNAFGFEFPIDVSNNEISSIGGMIATNASGDRSMRYGPIKEWIEEIEFVDGRGELIKTNKADLNDVCGMEGITGIIIAATLKVSPLIKRSASVFQTEKIDEALSIARKLRPEKEVVLLELISPIVSKLLGLPEKYNLIIEFNSDRGKIKSKEYDELSKLRKSVYYKLASQGYYNFEDPKFFFDKIKEFIMILEENSIPYIGRLGSGVIHPFFKDNEKDKNERIIEFIKKTKAIPGKFGIGITRKYFIDSFQKKLIQRVKARHDPFFKFNRGKVIDSDNTDYFDKKGSDNGIISEEIKALAGEEISAFEVLDEFNECKTEKTPEEKIQEFIKEVESIEKIEDKGEIKEIAEKEEFYEIGDSDVKNRLRDYEDTFKSELKEDRKQMVEEIARNIPKEIVRKEKIHTDYDKIQDIMTNNIGDGKNDMNSRENLETGKVRVSDNLDRKSENDIDRDLINKIMTNKFRKDEGKK